MSFFVILFCLFVFAHLFAPVSLDITQQILYLRTYNRDEINQEYFLHGFGSAVVIEDGKVVTNAHVILDEYNEPTWLYELCASPSPDEAPLCFMHAKLLQYDVNADLALLEIKDGLYDIGTPVTLSHQEASLGDDIFVYGYPQNGGSTITLTQWKISWVDKNNYKMDANTDGGSSWWWVFDKKNRLVGIPVFVVQGYSTMSYMIGVETLKKFLNKEWQILQHTQPVAKQFTDYLAHQNSIWWSETIQTPFFTLEDYAKHQFSLNDAYRSEDKKVAYFSFLHDDGVSLLDVSYGTSYGYISTDNARANSESLLRKVYNTVQKETITSGAMQRNEITAQGIPEDPKYEEVYFVPLDTNDINLSVSLSSNWFSPQARQAAREFFAAIQYKQIEWNMTKNATGLTLGHLVVPVIPWVEFFKDLSFGYTSYQFLFDTPRINVGTLDVFSFQKSANEDFEDIIQWMEALQQIRMAFNILSETFATNTQGLPYYVIHLEESSHLDKYLYIFMVEGDDDQQDAIYTIWFSLEKENTQARNQIKKLINAMTLL